MPYKIVKNEDEYCVHKENPDGTAGEKVKCHPTEGEAMSHMQALYANVEDANKYFVAVKAVSDWELDVLAVPFGSRDLDGQWFDDRTEIMAEQFQTPLIVYHHGIKQGAKGLEDSPLVIGKAIAGSLKKMVDGWHIRVILDKTIDAAKRVMDAARKGLVAVSSDSIAHLARLDVGNKLIQYEKNRPGRIATWALAGVSLWEKGNGNFEPASQMTYALPAMKAMYREAGIPFPDMDTGGGDDAEEVNRRARVKELQKQGKQIVKALKQRAKEQ